MQVIMWIDLAITLAAAIIGLVRWSKANRAWRLAIAAAWLLLFGSLSKALAFYNVIPDDGWGLVIGGIPVMMVLYVCGSEFLLLLGIWRSSRGTDR